MRFLRSVYYSLLFLALMPGLRAADTPAGKTLETFREWAATERAIVESQARLDKERQRLEDLRALYKAELNQRKAEPSVAAEPNARRLALAAEAERLETASETMRNLLGPIEQKLIALASTFPEPLQARVGEVLDRLRAARSTRGNVERLRDVIALLLEVEGFQRKVTASSAIIPHPEGGGRELAVRTLDFGLGAAFYVDEAGRFAGRRKLVDGAWRWEAAPELAPVVKKALAILEEHPEQARLLTFPLQATSPRP